jgi:hypothetical protein
MDAVREWNEIARENERAVNRDIATMMGHAVACGCKKCAKTRKRAMLPTWRKKWAAEEREGRDDLFTRLAKELRKPAPREHAAQLARSCAQERSGIAHGQRLHRRALV